MEPDMITRWVDGYVQAWQTNDPATIGQLFAENATYATGPFDEPWRGRDAIVAGWLRRRDEPQTWTFHYEVLATSSDGGVVRGWTTYPQRQQEYSNIWLLALDEAGRCTAFTEWWVERPRDSGATTEGTNDATAAS